MESSSTATEASSKSTGSVVEASPSFESHDQNRTQNIEAEKNNEPESSEHNESVDWELMNQHCNQKFSSHLKELEKTSKLFKINLNKAIKDQTMLQQKKSLQELSLAQLRTHAKSSHDLMSRTFRESVNETEKRLLHCQSELQSFMANYHCIESITEQLKELVKNDSNFLRLFMNDIILQKNQMKAEAKQYVHNTLTIIENSKAKYNKLLDDEKREDHEFENICKNHKSYLQFRDKVETELNEKLTQLEYLKNKSQELKNMIMSMTQEYKEIMNYRDVLNQEMASFSENSGKELLEYRNRRIELEEERKLKEHTMSQIEMKTNFLSKEEENLNLQMQCANAEHNMLLLDLSKEKSELAKLNCSITVENNITSNLKKDENEVEQLQHLQQELLQTIEVQKNCDCELNRSIKNCEALKSDLEQRCINLMESISEMESKRSRLEVSCTSEYQKIDSSKEEYMAQSALLEELEESSRRLEEESNKLHESKTESQARLEEVLTDIKETETNILEINAHLESIIEAEQSLSIEAEKYNEQSTVLERSLKRLSDLEDELRCIEERTEICLSKDHVDTKLCMIREEKKLLVSRLQTKLESVQISFNETEKNIIDESKTLTESAKDEISRMETHISHCENRISITKSKISESQSMCKVWASRFNNTILGILNRFEEMLGFYKKIQSSEKEGNGSKEILNVKQSIEQQLTGVLQYMEISQDQLTSPSYSLYKEIIDGFKARVEKDILKNTDKLDPISLRTMAEDMTQCLFEGKTQVNSSQLETQPSSISSSQLVL